MVDDGTALGFAALGFTDATEIGRGGFGVVYRAWDGGHGRHVAIKVLLGSLDDRARARFDRERQALGRLGDHPYIVAVHASGYTPQAAPYIVMDFVSGGSLADVIKAEGPLPWHRALRYGIQVAGANPVIERPVPTRGTSVASCSPAPTLWIPGPLRDPE